MLTAVAYVGSASADVAAALKDVTVTARKFSESLQQTPVAGTAFSGAALEQRSVSGSSDVISFVLNVDLGGSYSASNDGFFYGRGVGVSEFTVALDPPVGMNLDGVLLGRTSGALFDLVDASRCCAGRQGRCSDAIPAAVRSTSSAPRRA